MLLSYRGFADSLAFGLRALSCPVFRLEPEIAIKGIRTSRVELGRLPQQQVG
jgi:hypothetical protein